MIEPIYNQHVRRVYAFFYVKTFDQMLSEDLTSKVFLILVEKVSDKEVVIDNTGAYISGIMRNVWLRHLQEKYKQKTDAIENIDDFSAYVDESVNEARDDGLEVVAQPYIAKLPEKQKQILTMRLIEKKTLKDICRHLDKDMNYVRTTQKRGIARLKQLLIEEDSLLRKEKA